MRGASMHLVCHAPSVPVHEECKELLERYRDEVIPPGLLTQVEEGIVKTTRLLEEKRTDLILVQAERQGLQEMLDNRESITERNMGILREARAVLGGVGACSQTTRECIEEVRASLEGADGEVVKDMVRVEGEVERLQGRTVELGGEIEGLERTLESLEKGRDGLMHTMTDGTREALFALRREGVLHFGECNNCPIDRYRAFGGVDDVLDIEQVMKEDLVYVGYGIRMSQPVYVELGLKTGNIRTANISHNGIVAVCYCNSGFYLQLTNIFTKEQVEFGVEFSTATAFYDDIIIVMTFGQKLREAPVDALFTNPSTDTLKEIGDVKLWPSPPNTLTHQTRRVYYISSSNDLYEYNVDTKENNKIETGHRVHTIASSGGIDIGVKCVFRDYDDNKVYALKNDNTVKHVSDGHGSGLGFLRNVFPSSSNTTDLSRALYKMYGNFVFKNKKVKLECPVEFNEYYTIVRLYKDVFLACDTSGQWKMLRIQVP